MEPVGPVTVSRARSRCDAVLPAAAPGATVAAPTPPPGTQDRDEECPGPTAGTSETVVLLFAICRAVKEAQKLPGSTWDLEPAQDCALERLWQRPPPPGAHGWWAGRVHVVSRRTRLLLPLARPPDPAQLQRDEEVSPQPQGEEQA